MNTYRKRVNRIAVFIVAIVVMTTAFSGIVAAETSSNHAKTQILLYLVGSDLETEHGTGTGDLEEIAASYEIATLNENFNRSQLDIVVAFGGANNPGWQGMKVATADQLMADKKTGKFGNGNYLYSDPNADMGSEQSLEKFLSIVKASRTADRTILILSDHGNSYDGIGIDDKTKNGLKMGDIDNALKTSGMIFDPVMFDACLMASVEVGKTVQPYTGLMLGSEEIQRGSYSYSNVIDPLVSNVNTDSQTVMKKVADSYIDSKGKPKAKTMSIIDETKMTAVRNSLNDLGVKLNTVAETDQGLHDLKSAYNDAVSLGVMEGSKPTSVDLISLLENIKKKRPELAADVDATISIVKAAVIYERHNEYSPTVYGLSIASPDAMNLEKYNKYGDAVKVAPGWDNFFMKMVEASQKGSSDTTLVTTTVTTQVTEGTAATLSDSTSEPDKKMSTVSKPGFVSRGNGSYELRDPYGGASVYAGYYLINGSHALSIGTQPITPDKNGLYQIPAWDGQWYYFPGNKVSGGSLWDQIVSFLNGPTTKPQPLLVDMEFDDTTSGGYAEYNSWISIQDRNRISEATIVTYVNTSNNHPETIITPYIMTRDGNALFGGDIEKFETGSIVTSYSYGFDLMTKTPDEYTLSQVVTGSDTAMTYAIMPDGTYATGIMAYYDNDNEVNTDQFRIITIRNRAVISSTIGPLPKTG
jgi:hypothetical protein